MKRKKREGKGMAQERGHRKLGQIPKTNPSKRKGFILALGFQRFQPKVSRLHSFGPEVRQSVRVSRVCWRREAEMSRVGRS